MSNTVDVILISIIVSNEINVTKCMYKASRPRN